MGGKVLVPAIVIILFLGLIGFNSIPQSQAASESIPSWVKNNADWWSNGLISDKDFLSGIAYLAQEKIIQVDDVEIDSDGAIVIDDNVSVPAWIKNNARWWADGLIDDIDWDKIVWHYQDLAENRI